MMKFLCFQRQKTKDGGRYTTPVIKTKTRRYGTPSHVETVSRARPMLITGAHDSGKSRWLDRLHAEAPDVWGKKCKAPPLHLCALRPIGAWSDAPHIGQWWDGTQADKTAPPRPWAKLPAWEKSEALALYAQETGAVVFIDDAHKLAGRKLQIARACAMAARIWVVTASEEQRIAPNLRAVLMRRDPQVFRLGSEVSYDATGVMIWLLSFMLLAAGAWEAAGVVAGLRALSSGLRSSKNAA
jgi:hypothetical protein